MSVDNVAAISMSLAIADEPWRDFGFEGRPKVGSVFRSIRPGWKNIVEDRIVHTIICSVVATHYFAERFSKDSLGELLLKITEKPSVVTAFGFASRDDAIHVLRQLTLDFMEASEDELPSKLAESLHLEAITNLEMRSQLEKGAVTWAQSLHRLKEILNR